MRALGSEGKGGSSASGKGKEGGKRQRDGKQGGKGSRWASGPESGGRGSQYHRSFVRWVRPATTGVAAVLPPLPLARGADLTRLVRTQIEV